MRWRIAVCPKGTAHEFWKAVEKGARRADAELGQVEIVWKGPAGEGDADKQIQLVESFIADGMDGICLAPLDARALGAPVRQALERGVPVLIFDSGLADEAIPVVSYVATDNRHGGEIAGHELARLLGGEGEVVVLRYLVGSESTYEREEGALAALRQYPGITLLSDDRHGGPDESSAIQVAENLLATYGDRVDGFFTSNESNLSALITALERDPRGLAGKVQVVGFDSGTRVVEGLRRGVVQAIVLQDPVRMGYEAVKRMVDHLEGREVPKRIPTGETLVTTGNMDEPRNRELLFPLADG